MVKYELSPEPLVSVIIPFYNSFDTISRCLDSILEQTYNNLEIIIDVPALPLCNNNWILQEIKNCSSDTEINLIVGNDDRLQYRNNCN